MVRIAHISDTHLGARPRQGVKQNVWAEEMRIRLLENDFYERFNEIFSTIADIEPPVDIVIHSGDLYDQPWEGNPSQPPVVARETAISVLKEFIKNTAIPILIIEGNHGLYRSLEVSLLDSLKMAVPGLDVVTQQDLKQAFAEGKPLVYSYESLNVYCFPFLDYDVLKSSNSLPAFNDWITTHQSPSRDLPSIGVAHGMELDHSLYPAILNMDYDYIALGHDHHQHKHSKKAWYAGSPERWRFDEVRHEKGFLIVDIKAGKLPKVTPQHIEFIRQVYNEKFTIAPDESIQSLIEKIQNWFRECNLETDWNSDTAARVRLVFEGNSSNFNSLDLAMALEHLRMEVLAADSQFNLAQFVWQIRQDEVEYQGVAYPEIESEYLIENPEDDFKDYLGTLENLDEKFDSAKLTHIAVKALKLAVARSDEKFTLETLTEEGPL
jgi:DNA repair exonuclease SbcCD nuclease subunit